MLMILYHGALIVLLLLALRRFRWAYVAFALLGLLYFPAKQRFDLDPTACETLPSARLAFYSLQNYPHIVMFSFFFVLSYIQVRESGQRTQFMGGVCNSHNGSTC